MTLTGGWIFFTKKIESSREQEADCQAVAFSQALMEALKVITLASR